MKKLLRLFGAFCAIGSVVLVLFFCYYNAPPNLKAELWEILAAIGTLGAVVVALWVALEQRRSQAATERLRAQLVAARIFFPLTVEAARTRELAAHFGVVSVFDPAPNDSARWMEEVRKTTLPYDLETLEALAPLERRCAFKLAGAMGHLNAAQGIIQRSAVYFREPEARDKRVDVSSTLAFQLGECSRQLGSVAEICQNAALVLTSPFD